MLVDGTTSRATTALSTLAKVALGGDDGLHWQEGYEGSDFASLKLHASTTLLAKEGKILNDAMLTMKQAGLAYRYATH